MYKEWTNEQLVEELHGLIDVGAYNSAEWVLRELVIRREKKRGNGK